jgi:outer membrane biosynthesis protein TonB
MAKKKAKKKATKGSARKSLKLRKKPLRDLPAKKKVKGGDASLSPSQQAAQELDACTQLGFTNRQQLRPNRSSASPSDNFAQIYTIPNGCYSARAIGDVWSQHRRRLVASFQQHARRWRHRLVD